MQKNYKSEISISKDTFSRVRRNVKILLGGNGITVLLGFATLSFNARALGPELLGILALLQAFIGTTSKFFSFDTWQPVLKFGAEARSSNDDSLLRDVLVLGFLYDLAGAVAATLVGFSIVFIGLPSFGIDQQNQVFATIFAATLLFNVTSSVLGLLRLFGKFGLITGIQVTASATGLFAAIALWFFNAPFINYVIAYAMLSAAQSCAFLVGGAALWRRLHIPTPFAARLRNRTLRQAFLQFSWSTSAMSSINVLRQNADAFVIAALLGPAATGLYKVAIQIASLITRFGDPLQQALFPEIAKLVAKREYGRLRRILVEAFFAGITLLTVFVAFTSIFAEMAVEIVGGVNFSAAAAPLLWLALAYGLSVAGFYIRPTVVTLIGPLYHLKTYLAAIVAFMPALYFSINAFGIAGAGLAQVMFTFVWFMLNSVALVRRLKIMKKDLIEGLRQLLGRLLRPIKSPLTRVIGKRRIRGGIKVITEISQAGRHVWTGYYDLPVISPDGRRIAYHSWIPGSDRVEFGVYDCQLSLFQPIGSSRSWSFQFGTRLQFISDDVVIFYEERDGAVATCIHRLSDGMVLRRLEGVAYYSISASKSFLSALNYAHIKTHRKGYGFDCINQDADAALTLLDLRNPTTTVLWRLDKNDCAELARRALDDDSIQTKEVHLNCPAFSPDENKVAFVVASFAGKRMQQLFVSTWSIDKVIRCPLLLASHFCWTGNNEISVFGKNEHGVSGYWYWDLSTDELRPMGGAWPNFDGHQSRHPMSPETWLTDSYPNRLGYQSLYIISEGKRQRVADFYAPLGMAFDKCDLHPRWASQGDFAIIDTAYSGFRRTLVLKIS